MNKKIIISKCLDCPHAYVDIDSSPDYDDNLYECTCLYVPNCSDPDGIILQDAYTIPDWCKLENE